jgi:hypothetical protein
MCAGVHANGRAFGGYFLGHLDSLQNVDTLTTQAMVRRMRVKCTPTASPMAGVMSAVLGM